MGYPILWILTSGWAGVGEAEGAVCEPPCAIEVARGGALRLEAVPATGSEAGPWSGCSAVGDGACELVVDGDVTVTASFYAAQRRLRVQVDGDGAVRSEGGRIACPGTCEADFGAGEEVVLRAEPAASSTVAGWTGCSPVAGGCVVWMDEDRESR